MLLIWRHTNGPVEKDLLALRLRHLMQFPVLLRVARVPLEPGTFDQVVGKGGHTESICPVYTKGNACSCASAFGNRPEACATAAVHWARMSAQQIERHF